MKGIHRTIWYGCISCCFLLLSFRGAEAQTWEEQHENLNDRNTELTIQAGLMSYYGDLSIYDNNYFDKLSHESGFGGGVIITKRLAPQIGVSGQLLGGRLKGRKDNVFFESSVFEYNLHVRLDMVRIFAKYSKSKVKWDVFFGFGNFLFKSTKTTVLEGENRVENHTTRVPELLFLGGTGLSYRVNSKMSIMMDLSVHQFQNDKIDITVDNSDFDWFSALNFGFTYYIRSREKTAPRNKARIAHTSKKMKPLSDY